MKVQRTIQEKLTVQFQPSHLEIINESGNHRVPPGSESHFKVVLVSSKFEGKPTLTRHRMVNQTLASELKGPVHALSLRVFTPGQWENLKGEVAPSPPCAHAK